MSGTEKQPTILTSASGKRIALDFPASERDSYDVLTAGLESHCNHFSRPNYEIYYDYRKQQNDKKHKKTLATPLIREGPLAVTILLPAHTGKPIKFHVAGGEQNGISETGFELINAAVLHLGRIMDVVREEAYVSFQVTTSTTILT